MFVGGMFGAVEQLVHGAAQGFHVYAGCPFVAADGGCFAGVEFDEVGAVAVVFFAE